MTTNEDADMKVFEVPKMVGPKDLEEPAERGVPRATTGYEPEDIPDDIDPTEEFILERQPDGEYKIVGTRPRDSGESHLQTIHPGDNRVRVHNTTIWPWRTQGQIISFFPAGPMLGSGTMVNKHHVLTAAHNIYRNVYGGWANRIVFSPARNDFVLPYGRVWAARGLVYPGWRTNHHPDNDMGMLILQSDIGDFTGWMPIIEVADDDLREHRITVAGYPGDKDGGDQMWSSTGNIGTVNAENIQYSAFTIGGMSGGGVFDTWAPLQGERVCATHSKGPNGVPNTGCRISLGKYNQIVNWITNN